MARAAISKSRPGTSAVASQPSSSHDDQIVELPMDRLSLHPLLKSLYQDDDCADLVTGFRENGQLIPVIVEPKDDAWQVISGGRRIKAAENLGWVSIKAMIRHPAGDDERLWWLLASNQYRQKRFSEKMREADLMESLLRDDAKMRSLGNLAKSHQLRIFSEPECLNSDTPEQATATTPDGETVTAPEEATVAPAKGRKSPPQRTDARIAKAIGLGGKDIYRQARAIWAAFLSGDDRATAGVHALDQNRTTIHAAFKDLRRRDHLAHDFQPTPYDVWMFKHDRSYGIRYPGSIPAGILANTIHYFSEPGELVVDPMAGGGTTWDVCQSLDRRCLALDVAPARREIQEWDIACQGLPESARNCDLVFLDPPYHTMLRSSYAPKSVSSLDFNQWSETMRNIYTTIYAFLRPGGHIAVLIANQTEKDLPDGVGYIDHAFDTLMILKTLGFLPQRRIACPMDGAYRPDQIQNSRQEKRLLGQVRDLIIARKPNL